MHLILLILSMIFLLNYDLYAQFKIKAPSDTQCNDFLEKELRPYFEFDKDHILSNSSLVLFNHDNKRGTVSFRKADKPISLKTRNLKEFLRGRSTRKSISYQFIYDRNNKLESIYEVDHMKGIKKVYSLYEENGLCHVKLHESTTNDVERPTDEKYTNLLRYDSKICLGLESYFEKNPEMQNCIDEKKMGKLFEILKPALKLKAKSSTKHTNYIRQSMIIDHYCKERQVTKYFDQNSSVDGSTGATKASGVK